MNQTSSRAPGWKRISAEGLVKSASLLTLLSLALMVWSVLDRTPLPVMVAMSVGQGLGTMALLLYATAVVVYQVRLGKSPKEPKKQA